MDAVAGLDEDAAEGPWALPQGWVWAKAQSFADVVGGGTPSDAADPANFDPDGVPWITPADLSGYSRSTIRRGARSLSVAGFQRCSAQMLPVGSVLISSRAPVGYCAVAETSICTNQGFKSLRLKAPVDPFFIRYFVLYARRMLNDAASGTTFKELSGRAMEQILFPIAPLAEQRRIVARIDALFAEIAEGEAALAEARKGLDTFRRALLKAAVMGELTKDWRAANPDIESGHDFLVRTQGDRTKKLPAKSRRHSTRAAALKTAPPVLPEGWTSAPLGDLLSHLTSGSRDWAEYYDRGSKIFVMAQNVRPGRYNHSYVKHVDPPPHLKDVERSRLQRDDLLVTIVGANTGDVCRIDFDAKDHFVCQSVALMRPISHELSAYLEMYLVAPDGGRGQMNKVIYGAGRPHLSFDQIESLVIPIPPRAEIDEILRVVSDGMSAAYDTYAMLDAEAADATRLKQSVLKAAFEGRLSSQDPADEPASALVARLAVQAASEAKPRRTKKIAQ